MTQRETQGVLGFIFIAIALLGLTHLFTGCGQTLAQKLNMANEAAAGLRTVAGPQINNHCLTKANECKAQGIEVSEACKPLIACRGMRDAFYKAVEGVHFAVAAFRVAEAAGRPGDDLQSLLTAAQNGLKEAWELAIKAGLVAPAGTGAL